RDRLGESRDAELRRRVVRLAEVADQARGRGHVDVAPRLLRLEMRRGGAGDVERAVQVHVDDRTPFFHRHIEEEAVAQDACVVHHHIEPTEGFDGGFDYVVSGLPLRDAVRIGDGSCARAPEPFVYFVGYLLCLPGVTAFALDRGADVVHQ